MQLPMTSCLVIVNINLFLNATDRKSHSAFTTEGHSLITAAEIDIMSGVFRWS